MKNVRMTICILVFVFIIAGTALAGLQDGLVAYYPLNGNADDSSGNNLLNLTDFS